jgi:hypothetical protein
VGGRLGGPKSGHWSQTFTNYLIDISLIAIVLLQVRGRRLTTRELLLPVGIVAFVAYTYLRRSRPPATTWCS